LRKGIYAAASEISARSLLGRAPLAAEAAQFVAATN
jgi:hypothetical protein